MNVQNPGVGHSYKEMTHKVFGKHNIETSPSPLPGDSEINSPTHNALETVESPHGPPHPGAGSAYYGTYARVTE